MLIWRNRPENRRYFREYREISPTSHSEWYERVHNDNVHYAMFSIVTQDDWLVGIAGLTGIDWLNRSAEISLYIGDGYLDCTYAPDALQVLLSYGFIELGLRRTYAETYAFDVHKQMLLLGAGFQREGILRDAHWAEGQWHESYIYALLANEFHPE